MTRTLLLLVASTSAIFACQKVDTRSCFEKDENCVLRPGAAADWRCIFDGTYDTFCAHPDRTCASGYRWNEDSGPSKETCVNPTLIPDAAGPGDGGLTGG